MKDNKLKVKVFAGAGVLLVGLTLTTLRFNNNSINKEFQQIASKPSTSVIQFNSHSVGNDYDDMNFEYGTNIVEGVSSEYVDDLTALVKMVWNEVGTNIVVDPSDEFLRFIDDLGLDYTKTVLEDGKQQYEIRSLKEPFDVNKPITVKPELIIEENVVSVLVPVDYELYRVDETLPFPGVLGVGESDGKVKKMGVVVTDGSLESNPFLGGIAVYKPYYSLLSSRDSIINNSDEIILNDEGICSVPVGYTLYSKTGKSDEFVEIGSDGKNVKYQFLGEVNSSDYVIVYQELAHRLELIDQIEEIVKEDYYAKNQNLSK